MRLTVAPDEQTDLLMEIRGGGYFARRTLHRGDKGIKALLNVRLDTDPARQGFGTASQTVEAAAAVRLGIDRIEAIAASLDGCVGWLVLPRWGYDAELEQHLVDELPEHWSGLRRLGQVLEQDRGWAWWRNHGAILAVSSTSEAEAMPYGDLVHKLMHALPPVGPTFSAPQFGKDVVAD